MSMSERWFFMFILGNTFKNVKVETSWETYVMIAIYFAILLAIDFMLTNVRQVRLMNIC